MLPWQHLAGALVVGALFWWVLIEFVRWLSGL